MTDIVLKSKWCVLIAVTCVDYCDHAVIDFCEINVPRQQRKLQGSDIPMCPCVRVDIVTGPEILYPESETHYLQNVMLLCELGAECVKQVFKMTDIVLKSK